jgi:hypothetical protein
MTGEVPRHELELIADEIMADIKRWHVSAVTASAERSLRAAILARLARHLADGFASLSRQPAEAGARR